MANKEDSTSMQQYYTEAKERSPVDDRNSSARRLPPRLVLLYLPPFSTTLAVGR